MSKARHSYEYYKEQFPKQKLAELLLTKTYRDIGKEFDVDEHIISKIAKEYDIQKNNKIIKSKMIELQSIKFDYNKVYDLYINQHKSSIYISEVYKCSKKTVLDYLKRVGIQIRDPHDLICYESRHVNYSYHGIDSAGYVYLTVNSEIIREHRYIMEKFLGRKLKPNEYVHHIDFNKTNNNIENLFLFNSNEEHILYHAYIKNNEYIDPQTFLDTIYISYKEFLSFDNLFDLYIRKNESIKSISIHFADMANFNVKVIRTIIKSRLITYNLFDPKNLDVNQYIKKDNTILINKYDELKKLSLDTISE